MSCIEETIDIQCKWKVNAKHYTYSIPPFHKVHSSFILLLVLNELVHECIMGTGPDNKRGRGRLAPSRVYYQGRFP